MGGWSPMSEVPSGAFGGGPPRSTDSCVNLRHRDVGCDRCAAACPVDAVAIGRDGPVVDDTACARCDACVAACPVDALGARPSITWLRRVVADAAASTPVTVACPRGGTAGETTPNVIRLDRCLASLGPEELFGLASNRSDRRLWIDDAPCASCDLGSVHHQVIEAVDRADHLAAAFGRAVSVHRTTHGPRPDQAARPRQGTEVDAAAVTRRGLFRRVTEHTCGVAVAARDQAAGPTRRRLLGRLRETTPSESAVTGPVDGLGFGDVQVDPDRCSACGVCAQLCPTEALSYRTTTRQKDGTSSFELLAHPSSCVTCTLCTAACPEEAISVVDRVDPAAVVAGVAVVVAGGAIVACDVCGAPTAASVHPDGGRPRCFACRPGVVSSLRDERGLMADLLGRLRA